MAKVLLNVFFVLLMLGACSVMNEAGNIQPLGVVMCLVGAVGFLICGKEFYYGD